MNILLLIIFCLLVGYFSHISKGNNFLLPDQNSDIAVGFSYGATDEFGYHAVESPVDLHDLHATVLHLLGLDHTRLTYRYSGRDFRLTDVSGRVVQEIIV